MWLGLSLIGALLFAATNVVDTHFLRNVMARPSAGGLVILAGSASLPLAATLGALAHEQLRSCQFSAVVTGLAAGGLFVAGTYAYYRALMRAAATVAILFQLVVACNAVLGWLLLGERL